MRIFLTGATGFIGSRILNELLAAGHQVTGLARSEASALALQTAGADVQYGTLEEPRSLLEAVARCDAVIHTAFDHDFSRFVENCEKDQRIILAIGAALQGSRRPLIITSGTAMGDIGNGLPASEMHFNPAHPNPRAASERAGNRLLDAGVDVRVVRLPQVHDTVRQGLLTSYIERAVANGAVALRGEGSNRWSAAHVNDVARLYVSALLQGAAGERYHAVDEEGIALRDIATVIAQGLNLPLTHLDESQVDAWFGWFAPFTALDLRASSAWTRERLQWQPVGPGLLEDLSSTITETALCGLGQSACKPVQSTLKYFRDEYLAHVVEKHCPHCNGRKKELRIDPELCKGCGKCMRQCPMEAISGQIRMPHVIDTEKCIKCGACWGCCPFGAIREE